MSDYTIYHNPRCSKSRQTLQLLLDRGIEPQIIAYLDTPPSKTELKDLIAKLDISPRALLRKGEDAYKTLGLADTSKTDTQLMAAMLQEPKLIERPIVVVGERAVLGRPPENVLALID